jgi:hypothetical protein
MGAGGLNTLDASPVRDIAQRCRDLDEALSRRLDRERRGGDQLGGVPGQWVAPCGPGAIVAAGVPRQPAANSGDRHLGNGPVRTGGIMCRWRLRARPKDRDGDFAGSRASVLPGSPPCVPLRIRLNRSIHKLNLCNAVGRQGVTNGGLRRNDQHEGRSG